MNVKINLFCMLCRKKLLVSDTSFNNVILISRCLGRPSGWIIQFMSPVLFPLHPQTDHSAVVLPSRPAGQRTHRLPASPWHKTNLSAFICVGGSCLKALLQDWRSPISTISFWQATGGVTWHQLCTDGTWQARRSVMSAITGAKLVAQRTGKQRWNSWIKHACTCTQAINAKKPHTQKKIQCFSNGSSPPCSRWRENNAVITVTIWWKRSIFLVETTRYDNWKV